MKSKQYLAGIDFAVKGSDITITTIVIAKEDDNYEIIHSFSERLSDIEGQYHQKLYEQQLEMIKKHYDGVTIFNEQTGKFER